MASGSIGIQSILKESAVTHPHPDRKLLSFQRILLCTDFSPVSEAATAVAVNLCKRTGAKLSVFHVCEYGPYSAPTETEADYVAKARQKEEQNLNAVVKRVREQGVFVEGLTETGHPPVSIVDFIASHKIGLAIMGTHGFNGFERMMFGSTAESVFRNATCPVLVVGPRVAGKKQNRSCGPVVFATDFHEPAKQAAQHAIALANAMAASIHGLHVLPLSVEGEQQGMLTTIMKEALRQIIEQDLTCKTKTEYNVIYDSEVSRAIVDYAKEHDAGFIVLGVRRGPKLSSHLPPHLTYRMIATATCPVLTISLEAVRAASKMAP